MWEELKTHYRWLFVNTGNADLQFDKEANRGIVAVGILLLIIITGCYIKWFTR